MRSVRFSTVAMLTLFCAASALAALSKEYADFAKGPAELLFTKEEKKQWKGIDTDAEAKAFIDLFWARRDPTPTTAINESRRDYDERVKVAEERFRTGYGAGSKSDRGKVFILLGSPTKLRRSGSGPSSTIQTPTGRPSMRGDVTSPQSYSPKEVWEYEQGKTPIALGQPLVQIVFIDQYATGDWKLERSVQTDIGAVFEAVATAWIAQPDLKSVPVFDEAATAAVAITEAAAPLTELKNDAFRYAIEQARNATKPSELLFITYGEFITSEGVHFVPVQLYVPKSVGLTTDATVTLFGSVEKDGGVKAAVFEEPARLTATTDGVFLARSLALPPGTYRGSFGLAKDGKPIGAASVPMVVKGLDKDAPGVSALIVTNNVYPLTEAQSPTDPFAFGGLKVVPKSDGAFRNVEDLTYFFEVRNPGLDAATSEPKMSMKMLISGTTTEGKTVKMAGPAEMLSLRPLKGMPGHYGVGEAMALATFKPGSYTLSMKVTDLASNQSYDLTGNFRVVE